MRPYASYVLGKEIKKESAVVTTSNIEDTMQKYEVLAVGEGHYEFGKLITPDVKIGDIVYVQKHAEADTPQEIKDKGQAIFQASRIMLVEDK